MTTKLSLDIAGAGMTVAVEYDRYVYDRHNYKWTVTVDDKTWTGDDLRSGCADRYHYPPMVDMLSSLLTFLGACADSLEYGRRTGTLGENGDLFPRDLGEILVQCSEELSGALWELEGSDNV